MVDMTGIILAGGKSTRMGFNKALLEVNGTKLIDHIVKPFKDIFEEVIIVTNDIATYEYLNVRVVRDVMEKGGSIVGVFSGLLSASNQYSFVAACDMPCLNKELILHLSSLAKGFDAVVPFYGDSYEPLHAVYSKSCLKPISNLISSGNLKIADLFTQVKVRKVKEEDLKRFDPELISFTNMNTKEDLDRLYQLSRYR